MHKTGLLALVLVGACGSSTAGSPAPANSSEMARSEPSAGGAAENATPAAVGPCEELASVCHGHDVASPVVADCHRLGHAGDQEACASRHHECLAACQDAAAAHAPTGDAPAHGN